MGKVKTSIIALLSDFRWRNWYLGVMKGVILGIDPDVRIVDLCHDISSQDVQEGSFVLGNSFRYFPPDTIFLVVVDPGVGGQRRNLIVKSRDYTFVSPDNGVLSSIFEKSDVEKVLHVKPGKYTLELKGSTFYGRDVFAPIAAHLSAGVRPEEMGEEAKSVLTVPFQKPFVNQYGELFGRAVYVDAFGNVITNIEEEYLKSLFEEGDVPWGDCILRVAGREIRGIKRFYEQVEIGRLIALINSWGFLEVAVNMGSAWRYLGLKEKKSLEIFLTCKSSELKR